MSDEIAGAASEAAVEQTPAPTIEETALATFAAIEAREKAEATETAQPDKPIADGQPRGPDGKFLSSKLAEEAKPVVETKTPDQTEPGKTEAKPEQASTPAPGKPPPGWSAASKAEWDKLPPSIQADVLKREDEVSSGFKQKSEDLKRYEPIEQVLGPRRQQLAREGLTEAQAINQLFALSDFAAKDLPGFIRYMAQARNLDLRTLVPQAAAEGQPQAEQQFSDPHLAAALKRIETVEGKFNGFLQSVQQRQQAETQSQIAAFAADPKHAHFETVRPQMAALLQAGQAKDLAEAYEMAVYAHPTIRPQLIEQQRKDWEAAQAAEAAKRQEEQRKADEEKKRQADEAKRKASVNLRSTGALPGRAGTQGKTIEDTAREVADRMYSSG